MTVNIPHRVIHYSGLCGLAGRMVYWLLTLASAGRLLSNFAGAFAVGLVTVLFAKWKKCPITLFSVPGVPAYMAVRCFIDGRYMAGMQKIMRVAIITVAIALGFLLSPRSMSTGVDLGENLPRSMSTGVDLGENLPQSISTGVDLGENLPQSISTGLDLAEKSPQKNST